MKIYLEDRRRDGTPRKREDMEDEIKR